MLSPSTRMTQKKYDYYQELFRGLIKRSSQYHNVDENSILSSPPTKHNNAIKFICKILHDKGADAKTIAKMSNKAPKSVASHIEWVEDMLIERKVNTARRNIYKKILSIHDGYERRINSKLLTYEQLCRT